MRCCSKLTSGPSGTTGRGTKASRSIGRVRRGALKVNLNKRTAFQGIVRKRPTGPHQEIGTCEKELQYRSTPAGVVTPGVLSGTIRRVSSSRCRFGRGRETGILSARGRPSRSNPGLRALATESANYWRWRTCQNHAEPTGARTRPYCQSANVPRESLRPDQSRRMRSHRNKDAGSLAGLWQRPRSVHQWR